MNELILEMLCAAAVCAWLWLPVADGLSPSGPSRWALLVVGLVVFLPLVQLMPLPPVTWTSLGGQQDRIAALALVGVTDTWQPISRSPAQTLASLLAMLPPLLLLLAVSSLDAPGRRLTIRAIAVIALLGALFGAVQLSAGGAAPRFYPQSHQDVLTGFQANRNAEADVLLIGLLASVMSLAPSLFPAVGFRGPHRGSWIASRRSAALVLVGVGLLFVVATILTASRTGIVLIPLALAATLFLAPQILGLGRWRWLGPLVVTSALILVIGIFFVHGDTALAKVVSRFALSGDARVDLWKDAWFAIRESWPFGVGMGGAQSALVAAERLEALGPMLPNRVHNDYLEIVLEGGILGIALVSIIASLLIGLAVNGWRARPQSRPEIALGVAVLLIIGLHSIVDYPLRSMSLSCLAGVAAALLVAPGKGPLREGPRGGGIF